MYDMVAQSLPAVKQAESDLACLFQVFQACSEISEFLLVSLKLDMNIFNISKILESEQVGQNQYASRADCSACVEGEALGSE